MLEQGSLLSVTLGKIAGGNIVLYQLGCPMAMVQRWALCSCTQRGTNWTFINSTCFECGFPSQHWNCERSIGALCNEAYCWLHEQWVKSTTWANSITAHLESVIILTQLIAVVRSWRTTNTSRHQTGPLRFWRTWGHLLGMSTETSTYQRPD